ncbi:hypothetical protein MGYG_03745 [Nannizzia gypsea CBS 118893]|uniref:Uncharacterized protein n=1 Tax=Arthroderma gypseum (strain ATCC MYA-4604 / CBS 118893) TaxID=535722 RepID=E4UTN1_ARTGP|nr:hypothetical protein MGYG_03745 [Nannizzia gypsea CBS 118893]EFR00740.1 hypothetical protein MGYG_03745 [Nannizzia gypsea CBS 118893]
MCTYAGGRGTPPKSESLGLWHAGGRGHHLAGGRQGALNIAACPSGSPDVLTVKVKSRSEGSEAEEERQDAGLEAGCGELFVFS